MELKVWLDSRLLNRTIFLRARFYHLAKHQMQSSESKSHLMAIMRLWRERIVLKDGRANLFHRLSHWETYLGSAKETWLCFLKIKSILNDCQKEESPLLKQTTIISSLTLLWRLTTTAELVSNSPLLYWQSLSKFSWQHWWAKPWWQKVCY